LAVEDGLQDWTLIGSPTYLTPVLAVTRPSWKKFITISIISIILVIIFIIATLTPVGIAKSPKCTLWWKVISDVTNGLERRDEDGGKLEILRLVVGGNMAAASLDTAPVGEVDMGDELEDDEEAACYYLNKKSERSLWWWPYPPYRDQCSQ
jgi:hypothetical protein